MQETYAFTKLKQKQICDSLSVLYFYYTEVFDLFQVSDFIHYLEGRNMIFATEIQRFTTQL